MAHHRQWHVSGWLAIILAPFAIIAALVVRLVVWLFGLKNSEDLTPDDVENYLQNFIQGGGGEWDWDDFTSIPITDPSLETVRQEAALVPLPLDDAGENKLRELLDRVRSLQSA